MHSVVVFNSYTTCSIFNFYKYNYSIERLTCYSWADDIHRLLNFKDHIVCLDYLVFLKTNTLSYSLWLRWRLYSVHVTAYVECNCTWSIHSSLFKYHVNIHKLYLWVKRDRHSINMNSQTFACLSSTSIVVGKAMIHPVQETHTKLDLLAIVTSNHDNTTVITWLDTSFAPSNCRQEPSAAWWQHVGY